MTYFKNYLPIFGIIIYVLLYCYSATLYPGGSQADLNTSGFDWVNNYWCNLMNEVGMNGRRNPARPFAITATITICFSLMFFIFQFAKAFSKNKIWRKSIQFSGIFSTSLAMLIFTKYHDLMICLSSFFGAFVMIGIVKEIYWSNLTIYKIWGVGCLLLLIVNNYIYYTWHGITYLPLLQKITLGIVLAWVAGLNLEIVRLNHAKDILRDSS